MKHEASALRAHTLTREAEAQRAAQLREIVREADDLGREATALSLAAARLRRHAAEAMQDRRAA